MMDLRLGWRGSHCLRLRRSCGGHDLSSGSIGGLDDLYYLTRLHSRRLQRAPVSMLEVSLLWWLGGGEDHLRDTVHSLDDGLKSPSSRNLKKLRSGHDGDGLRRRVGSPDDRSLGPGGCRRS